MSGRANRAAAPWSLDRRKQSARAKVAPGPVALVLMNSPSLTCGRSGHQGGWEGRGDNSQKRG